jgi:hypothetical protein
VGHSTNAPARQAFRYLAHKVVGGECRQRSGAKRCRIVLALLCGFDDALSDYFANDFGLADVAPDSGITPAPESAQRCQFAHE